MTKKRSKMHKINDALVQLDLFDRVVTVTQLCEITGLGRASITMPIRKGRLKAELVAGEYQILASDYIAYRNSLYNREHSKIAGKKLYNTEEGTYPLILAAKYCKMGYSSLYYHLRHGRLKAKRVGASWIFKKEDLDKFLEKYHPGICKHYKEA
jgi:excisionase family DNA binding protein